MTRQRCHLTTHAILDSIPLRIGQCLSGRKIYLEDCEDDKEGTDNQRVAERKSGNRHVLADFWVEGRSQPLGRWRFVLGKPREDRLDPPVVTVLPLDRSETKSEGLLTELLKRERESGKHDWLTPQYVAEVLRPLYRNGQLSRVEHLTEHIREKDRAPLLAENAELRGELNATNEERERIRKVGLEATYVVDELQVKNSALTADNTDLKKRIQQLEAAKKALVKIEPSENPLAQPQAADLNRPAVAVTERWRSRTENAQYINVGVEAFVQDVKKLGTRTRITYIDRKGASKQIDDFGVINGFVAKVFDYLDSRRGERAVFLITRKAGGPLKLASDTMMLETYKHLWT